MAFRNAAQRCMNPKHPAWPDYGGRGIKFLFESFELFMLELGLKPSPKHSLDRFPNNDGHYESGNVRWATAKEQMANRRAYRPRQNHVTHKTSHEVSNATG